MIEPLPDPTPDEIDEAIAAADEQAAQIPVARMNITLPTGRPAQIIVPLPLHPSDIGAITAMLAQVYHETQTAQTPEQQAAAAARSRLVLPT